MGCGSVDPGRGSYSIDFSLTDYLFLVVNKVKVDIALHLSLLETKAVLVMTTASHTCNTIGLENSNNNSKSAPLDYKTVIIIIHKLNV